MKMLLALEGKVRRGSYIAGGDQDVGFPQDLAILEVMLALHHQLKMHKAKLVLLYLTF